MPFTPFDTRYSPHIDLTMHPETGVVTIVVAFHPLNKGANCKVYELPPPYTGQPVPVRDWKQGQPGMLGPFGHGASLILPTGALLVAVPLGIDSAENVTPTMLIEPGYAEPYTLGGGEQGKQGEPGAPGAGGITLLPAPVTTPAWEGRMLSGGVLVDMPAVFGVPSASAYLIRFVAQAALANVRVRAGTETAPYFLTVNTQQAGVQIHAQGWAPGPICYISVVNGPATVWLQLCGFAT